MSSSSEPNERAEIDKLANLAKNGTPEEKNDAFKDLIPLIQNIARRMVRQIVSSPGFDTEGFVEESPGIIFEKLAKYDSQRRFVPWASTVLRNTLVDRLRKKRELQASARAISPWDLEQDRLSPDDITYVDRALDARTEMCQEDVAIFESELTPQARVTASILAGIHERVPPAKWKEWLLDAGFEEDFQPPDFGDEGDIPRCIEILAEYLGEAKQTIRMRWQRALPTLRKLKIFEDYA